MRGVAWRDDPEFTSLAYIAACMSTSHARRSSLSWVACGPWDALRELHATRRCGRAGCTPEAVPDVRHDVRVSLHQLARACLHHQWRDGGLLSHEHSIGFICTVKARACCQSPGAADATGGEVQVPLGGGPSRTQLVEHGQAWHLAPRMPTHRRERCLQRRDLHLEALRTEALALTAQPSRGPRPLKPAGTDAPTTPVSTGNANPARRTQRQQAPAYLAFLRISSVSTPGFSLASPCAGKGCEPNDMTGGPGRVAPPRLWRLGGDADTAPAGPPPASANGASALAVGCG